MDLIDSRGVHGQELGHLVEAVLLVHRDDAVATGVGGEGLLVQVLRLLRDHHVRDLGERWRWEKNNNGTTSYSSPLQDVHFIAGGICGVSKEGLARPLQSKPTTPNTYTSGCCSLRGLED